MSEPGGNTTPEHPYWVAEFIGDVAVVNGKVWPKIKVEPKKLSLPLPQRLQLGGLQPQVANAGIRQPEAACGKRVRIIWVIGTDGGYLDTPATAHEAGLNYAGRHGHGRTRGRQTGDLSPVSATRSSSTSSAYAPGTTLEMRNDAWNPYPFGDAPPIPQIMQFEVRSPMADASRRSSRGSNFDPATMSPRVRSHRRSETAHGETGRPPTAHPQRG